MKVLFVGTGSTRPEDGGSFTFEQSIRAAIERHPWSNHSVEYYSVDHVNFNRHALELSVRTRQVDFVWFLGTFYRPVNVPFAVTVWDLGHRELPEFPEVSVTGWYWHEREAYYSHVLQRATRVITGNAAGQDAITRFYHVDEHRIVRIPLSVDLEELRRLPDPSPDLTRLYGLADQEYLFYPAQFWPHKNHITLVDMLSVLHARGRPFKLVFAGSDKGNRAHVQAAVNAAGLAESVVFTGFVERDVLKALYRGAYALVYASLLGPDNLPPLEAMALGCPVIHAHTESVHDQLKGTGLLFKPLDAMDAAECVVELAERRDRLIRSGHDFVEHRGVPGYVRAIEDVLDDVTSIRTLWASGDTYRHT